jgi:predicted type IV restriction endonuclease
MVPSGTYKGRGTQAKVVQDNGSLVISSLQDIHICTHPISNEKGKLVSNTDLRRQKSDKIDKMITDISLLFESPVLALQYMENIRREKPRYIRDQLSVLKQTTQTADNLVINEALQYCINMNVFSANDFKSVVTSLLQKNTQMEILDSNPVLMNPLNGNRSTQADCYPMKSSINDYELLMAGGK